MESSARPPLPDPSRAGSWDDLTELLRDLHRACGRPTYDALSARSGLPKSAISYLVGRNPVRQPSESTVVRFVEGCLGYAGHEPARIRAESAAWRTARARLASVVVPVGVASVTEVDTPGAADETGEAGPTPAGRRRLLSRRPRSLAFGAVALALTAAAVAGGIAHSQVPNRRTAAPTTGIAATSPAARDQPQPTPVPSPSSQSAASVKQEAINASAGATGPVCVARAEQQVDTRLGRTWDHVFYCPNRPTLVYTWAVDDGRAIADLESRSSWFVCWTPGRSKAGRPTVFYYTQGDTTFGRPDLDSWGFVPADAVSGSGAPAAGVTRRCDFPTEPTTR